jgi:hypothetical protein
MVCILYNKIYFVHFNGFQCNSQPFSIAPTACGDIKRLRAQSHLMPLLLNAQCWGAQGGCTEPRWRHFWLCKPRKSKLNAAMRAWSTVYRLVSPALSPCLHEYLRRFQKCAGGNRKNCFTSKQSIAVKPKLAAASGWSRQGCPKN